MRTVGDTNKESRLKVLFNKFHTIRRRDAFEWWKKKHDKCMLVKELTNTGKTRVEYWQAMKEIENIKEFMRKE